jgi:methylated-DNA-[protein]-cysteine S-methyltransferase
VFSLDRLETPIGIALLVTDSAGILRALDWEDYAPRMKELLRLHHGSAPADRWSNMAAGWSGSAGC